MDVLAPETVPFAVSLGLTAAIALIELLGLLFGAPASAAIDNALPDFDLHFDAGHAELGPLSHSLTWLAFGKLPALIVIILITASFGLIGFGVQQAMLRTFGFELNPWIASVPAAIGSAYVARYLGHALARIMPKEETEAVSTAAFIGRIAKVFRGTASNGKPAEAKLTDAYGKTHYVLVEPDEVGQTLPEGSEVLIIRQHGAVYRVITQLKPTV